MIEVIGFFMVIAVIVFFPYRLMYHRLNRIIDAKRVFTGAALIVFAIVAPAAVDYASLYGSKEFINGFDNAGADIAQALRWIMAFTGTAIIGFTIWDARQSLK